MSIFSAPHADVSGMLWLKRHLLSVILQTRDPLAGLSEPQLAITGTSPLRLRPGCHVCHGSWSGGALPFCHPSHARSCIKQFRSQESASRDLELCRVPDGVLCLVKSTSWVIEKHSGLFWDGKRELRQVADALCHSFVQFTHVL